MLTLTYMILFHTSVALTYIILFHTSDALTYIILFHTSDALTYIILFHTSVALLHFSNEEMIYYANTFCMICLQNKHESCECVHTFYFLTCNLLRVWAILYTSQQHFI